MMLVVMRPSLAVALPSSACKLELNMPRRVRQILFIVSILWISWLAMMLVHESGHVLGAVFTGGRVRRVVWHPAVISRTDVRPNPHPLIEVWAGPLIGSIVPLAFAVLASVIRLRVAHVLWVVAGFCLIANGAYIGIGAVRPVGDAKELIELGVARWTLALFGMIAAIPGLWIWHRVSPKVDFGKAPEPVSDRLALGTFVIAVLMTALGVAFGNRGV